MFAVQLENDQLRFGLGGSQSFVVIGWRASRGKE